MFSFPFQPTSGTYPSHLYVCVCERNLCWRMKHCTVLRCAAVCCVVCCSALQCVAVCCSVLQCVAICCCVLQCVTVCCSVLQCVAVCCSVLQCVAVCCSVLQRVAVRCSTQCVAVCTSITLPWCTCRTLAMLKCVYTNWNIACTLLLSCVVRL